jgi:hypothetical protein
MKKKDTGKTLEEAIIGLYLDVKVRKQVEVTYLFLNCLFLLL